MDKTGRLFFAIVPDAVTKQQIFQYARFIRRDPAEKIIPADNLHITLRYVGCVKTDIKKQLVALSESVAINAFELTLDKLAYWKKPGISWVGCNTTPPELLKLAGNLESMCQSVGLEANNRDFVPHMSIIRRSVSRPSVLLPHTYSLKVSQFSLFESLPIANGVVYKELNSWFLRAPADSPIIINSK